MSGTDSVARITIRALAPELLNDWLTFFDGDAFADNPDWSGCYCYWHHADHAALEWDSRTPAENRAASIELIMTGRLQGYLAYRDARVAGWCQAASRLSIPNLAADAELAVDDANKVGSIVCFLVAPSARKQGVARLLLEAACTGFAMQGLRIAEAYPSRSASSDASNYHGPPTLYLQAGFEPYRQLDSLTIVRRSLATLERSD